MPRPEQKAGDASLQPSSCWECGLQCGSILEVQNGRVTDIKPNPGHPGSKGAFCVKGIRAVQEWTYQDARLRTPLRRTGPRGSGNFEPVTWDTALDEIAERLAAIRQRTGARSIVGAVSGIHYSRGVFMAQLMRAIGSPNWMINQDLCGGSRATSSRMTGLNIGMAEDIDHAKCILVAGNNPSISDPIAWMAMKRAKKTGARLIVIDPFQTAAAELADLWLQPRPGTDSAIALAMIKVLIDENLYDAEFVSKWCFGFDELAKRVSRWSADEAARVSGVPAGDIVKAARMYAAGPSVFTCGHGIDAASNAVQMVRSYHCLVGISGNVDRIGGNRRAKRPNGFKTYSDILFDPRFRLTPEIEAERIGFKEFPLWSGPLGFQMACHNPSVLRAMREGDPYPVRALFASGVNIALTYLDTATTIDSLKSLDLFVAAAHTMTPTAVWADYILPKTTTLEEEDVALVQQGPCVSFTAAAAERDGDVRSDLEIAKGLVDRLAARGAADPAMLPWGNQREFNAFLLERSDIDFEKLRQDGYATFPYELGNFENEPFATPSGKVELYSQNMASVGHDPLPDFVAPTYLTEKGATNGAFPLILQTGMREKSYHHSRFREQPWAHKVSPDPFVHVNPATAAQYGIADGSWVTVKTPHVDGQCRLKAKVTDHTLEGVLVTGVGWWRPEQAAPHFGARDVNINSVMSYTQRWDKASGSADTRYVACQIVHVSSPELGISATATA